MSEEIIRITRSWLGTPYHHQESVKGAGCDCLGLLRGVWREFYGKEDPEIVPNYSPTWGEHRTDDPLLSVVKKYFDKIENVQESSILMFRMRPDTAVKHCSICSAPGKMIHAYSLNAVREDDITEWWLSKLVGVFSWRL